MSIVETFGRWFGTESFIRRESLKWAQTHFPTSNQQVASAVGYALAETLGVEFERLTPKTNIIDDLAADEWCEWADIQMCMEDELECYFAPQPAFSGRTIAELVDFVAAAKLPTPSKKPKRGVFPPTGWCLAGCLESAIRTDRRA